MIPRRPVTADLRHGVTGDTQPPGRPTDAEHWYVGDDHRPVARGTAHRRGAYDNVAGDVAGDRLGHLLEFTWLAVSRLVPLVWIVLSVFEVQQGAFATTAAAPAAGRAYALAPDDATGRQRAEAAVRQVIADQGPDGQQARVSVRCETPTPGSCHVGTAVIVVEVASLVSLPMAPEVLGRQAASFAVTATHRVPIGQYVESAAQGDGR